MKLQTIFCLLILALVISGCAGETPYQGIAEPTPEPTVVQTDYSGYIVVTTASVDNPTNTTTPGLLAIFKPDGSLHSYRDYYGTSEFPSGVGFVSPSSIYVAIGNSTRIEKINLDVPSQMQSPEVIGGGFINGTPNRQMTTGVDGSLFLVEATANTIEKIGVDGNRAGAPFIPSSKVTGGTTCTISAPWGITSITSQRTIAAITSNAASGRLSIYDEATGDCIANVTTAPFNAGTPIAVAFHALTNRLLVAFNTTHAIYSCSVTGTGCVSIFLNSAIINSPRAIAVGPEGEIYVGSNGTETIEKLNWTGSGSATRATSGSFIGPSVFTLNPTSILVIP